jgi:hypothetical protein
VVGVGDGVAFGQDGEVGREECTACGLDKAKISPAVCGRSGVPGEAYTTGRGRFHDS